MESLNNLFDLAKLLSVKEEPILSKKVTDKILKKAEKGLTEAKFNTDVLNRHDHFMLRAAGFSMAREIRMGGGADKDSVSWAHERNEKSSFLFSDRIWKDHTIRTIRMNVSDEDTQKKVIDGIEAKLEVIELDGASDPDIEAIRETFRLITEFGGKHYVHTSI